MILIPDLETVVILVPRTGSGSLYRAVLARYPRAMMLYRHMEADGVPRGYDSWRRIGVVRDPLERLWSLWKYANYIWKEKHQELSELMADELARSLFDERCGFATQFEGWLRHNSCVYPLPFYCQATGRVDPLRCMNHAVPETRKSQWHYIRPDLGGEFVLYEDVHCLWEDLDLPEQPKENSTSNDEPMPSLDNDTKDYYLRRTFAWEYSIGYKL